MLEARIAFYGTCDKCGVRSRVEVPWSPLRIKIPDGWAVRTVVTPQGAKEEHLCVECTAEEQERQKQRAAAGNGSTKTPKAPKAPAGPASAEEGKKDRGAA